MRLNPGVTEDQARAELIKILEEMAEEAALTADAGVAPEPESGPKSEGDEDEDAPDDSTEGEDEDPGGNDPPKF